MLLSIGLLILIIWNGMLGYREGLVSKAVHLFSYIVAIWVAIQFTHPISSLLVFDMNSNLVIINAIIFMILFIITFIIVRKIGQLLNEIANLPLLNLVNKLLGVILGLILGYIICSLIISLGIPLINNQWLNAQVLNSPVAHYIMMHSLWNQNWMN